MKYLTASKVLCIYGNETVLSMFNGCFSELPLKCFYIHKGWGFCVPGTPFLYILSMRGLLSDIKIIWRKRYQQKLFCYIYPPPRLS